MRRSLALRLALATGLWLALGLGAAAWFINDTTTRQLHAAFDARLASLLDGVIAAVSVDAEGKVSLSRDPSGAEFDLPLSGAYWVVRGPGGQLVTSRSLWDQTLPLVLDRSRSAQVRELTGPRGTPLRLMERYMLLPGAPGPVLVAVALSSKPLEVEVSRLRRVLLLVFGLLGLGLIGGVVTTVVIGLAPLRRARRALAEVRAGERQSLDIEAPAEVAPLVSEVNALIAGNRATVERARAHLGNLAHALKTPLAVLGNALAQNPPDLAAARMETRALERLVHHHLSRARAMAQLAASALPASAPHQVAEEVARALRRLFAERDLTIDVAGDAAARVRVDPQDLAEMLGNLMENACKWAKSSVAVGIARERNAVAITVDDDGPGLSEGACASALERGVRLDEQTPGSGLGLAIVADLAGLHEGTLTLGPAPEGGLRARLALPAAQSLRRI
ncbi:HAMP domain-containing histidine kinase [Acetobacteraceae bacterium H6797]|nr:HAMP domain-containing histidine kinase [Acetobacteraceae bacterium H6797]